MPGFPCTVRAPWILFPSISGERTILLRLLMTALSLSRSLSPPTAVSSTRSRLCRSCAIWRGYTLGRSDLLRRAMSKKKGDVMQKERQIFVYGDEETGVPGCIRNGIDEKTANKIYDEMIDFAKYAFNKSHAAAYAVVAYQTAWLKYYYPVEFMAALMTSVIENPSKVAEYIYACRQMDIQILPPDINKGEADFSVDNGNIRYGLAAIKSVGKPVIRGDRRGAEGIWPVQKSGGFYHQAFSERRS